VYVYIEGHLIIRTVKVDRLIADAGLRNPGHPDLVGIEHFRVERTADDVDVGVFHRDDVLPYRYTHEIR